MSRPNTTSLHRPEIGTGSSDPGPGTMNGNLYVNENEPGKDRGNHYGNHYVNEPGKDPVNLSVNVKGHGKDHVNMTVNLSVNVKDRGISI